MHEEIERFCPNCSQQVNNKGIPVGVRIETIYNNYSGVYCDICKCPECGKKFWVSYKVDEITEME